jgi:APA family basic amino acid/polyamine antiporter
MSRILGSPGWLLVAWIVTGVLTVSAALSYGELAGMMPSDGGQYVYLREAFSPLWGFLYGWTLVLVIQTGTIAALAVAFARFSGVLFPTISEDQYLFGPWHISSGYALSLSTVQLVAILMIVLLTGINLRGLNWGKYVQNVFTVLKIGALLALIVLGLAMGWNSSAVARNFGDFWTPHPSQPVAEGLTAVSGFGLFVALCLSQMGSLWSADAWNNVTTIAGEVKQPRRNVPLALGLGTGIVICLYLLVNLAYLVSLPFETIQNVSHDLVGTALLETIFPSQGGPVIAAALMISIFGCTNLLVLAGARASYAMARDGLFFQRVGRLNLARVPGWGLVVQGIWACALVLPRTINQEVLEGVGKYGNLYNQLLEYVISAALLFYILTILGVFRLRRTRPDAPRPYRAFGYPYIPGLYVIGATTILAVLFRYQWPTTGPGLVIVLLGVPVYGLWRLNRAR